MDTGRKTTEHRAAVAAAQLLRKLERAHKDYQIFEPGDNILVGISGGKDSLTLLRLLTLRSIYEAEKPRIVPVHISGNYTGEPAIVPSELAEWVYSLGSELIVRNMIIPEGEPLPMSCERCSRNRKRSLFEAAKGLGCNKIALGHNRDDFAETAFMNLLTQGRLEAMPVCSTYFENYKLIRPLVYLSGKKISQYAKLAKLPVLQNTCPLADTSHRAKARELMQKIKADFPDAEANIYRAALKISSD